MATAKAELSSLNKWGKFREVEWEQIHAYND